MVNSLSGNEVSKTLAILPQNLVFNELCRSAKAVQIGSAISLVLSCGDLFPIHLNSDVCITHEPFFFVYEFENLDPMWNAPNLLPLLGIVIQLARTAADGWIALHLNLLDFAQQCGS